MRKSMFPVSWLIQARLADVATIVDENINGVRVVKSFAAEQQQLADPGQGGRQGAVGVRQGRRPAGPVDPGDPEPPPGGPGPGARCSAATWSSTGTLRHRRHPGLQRLPAHAAGAVHDARHDHHDGPAGRRLGRAGSTRSSTRSPRSSTGPAPSTSSTARATSASTRWASPTGRGRPARVLDRPRPAPAPGRDGGPGRAHRHRASRRWPGCSPASTTSTGGPSASTATTSGT